MRVFTQSAQVVLLIMLAIGLSSVDEFDADPALATSPTELPCTAFAAMVLATEKTIVNAIE